MTTRGFYNGKTGIWTVMAWIGSELYQVTAQTIRGAIELIQTMLNNKNN